MVRQRDLAVQDRMDLFHLHWSSPQSVYAMRAAIRKTRARAGSLWKGWKDRLTEVLLQNTDSHSIALGAGIGVCAGALLLPGLQCAMAFGLAWAFRASRLAALTFVWTANPLFFYVEYIIGRAVLVHLDWLEASSFSTAQAGLASDTGASLAAILTGGVFFGPAAGLVSYLAVLGIVLAYRRTRAPAASR